MIPTEERLWEVLRTIKVTSPVPIKFSSGITRWLCPLGMNSQGLEITARGTTRRYVPVGVGNPHWLWQQELMIYRWQRSTAIARATQELDKIMPLNRKKEHSANDLKPWPEDFGG